MGPASHVVQDTPGTSRYLPTCPSSSPLLTSSLSPRNNNPIPLRTGRRGAGGKRKGPSGMGSTFRLELNRAGMAPPTYLRPDARSGKSGSDKGLLPRLRKT